MSRLIPSRVESNLDEMRDLESIGKKAKERRERKKNARNQRNKELEDETINNSVSQPLAAE